MSCRWDWRGPQFGVAPKVWMRGHATSYPWEQSGVSRARGHGWWSRASRPLDRRAGESRGVPLDGRGHATSCGGMEGATVGRHAQSFQGIAPAEQEGRGVMRRAIGWKWNGRGVARCCARGIGQDIAPVCGPGYRIRLLGGGGCVRVGRRARLMGAEHDAVRDWALHLSGAVGGRRYHSGRQDGVRTRRSAG